MNAVDTNVLLYVHDPRNPLKQSQAAALIASLPDAVLIWQVACEYVAASRKLVRYGHFVSSVVPSACRLCSLSRGHGERLHRDPHANPTSTISHSMSRIEKRNMGYLRVPVLA